MDYSLTILLGLVQGITEFLPISSDGHLAVLLAVYEQLSQRKVLNALGLEIVLHAGTLLAIVVFYWGRMWRLLGEDRRVLALLVVGTVPAVAVGLPLHRWGGAVLTDPLLAGAMLPLTGLVLLWGARRPTGTQSYRDLSYGQALLIGIFQTAAILPGLSRSGLTISAGLATGLRRDEAASFSFLLAVPVVAGACSLELLKLLRTQPGQTDWGPLLAGAIVAFGAGLIALAWLLRWLQSGRIHYFAWWCIPLGLAVVVWQIALRWPYIAG